MNRLTKNNSLTTHFVGKTPSCIANIPSIATISMDGNLAASNKITLIYLLTQQSYFQEPAKDKLEKEIENIYS